MLENQRQSQENRRTSIYRRTHTQTHTQTHTDAHTRTKTHTQTQTDTHTHKIRPDEFGTKQKIFD